MIAFLLGLICTVAVLLLLITRPRSIGVFGAVLFSFAGCRHLERGSTVGAVVFFIYAATVFVMFVVFLRPEVKLRR